MAILIRVIQTDVGTFQCWSLDRGTGQLLVSCTLAVVQARTNAYVIHTLAAGINGSLPRIINDKKFFLSFEQTITTNNKKKKKESEG